jgi:hypothetical protein
MSDFRLNYYPMRYFIQQFTSQYLSVVGTGFFGKRFFFVKATHDFILVVCVVYLSRMLFATQMISLYH